MSYLILDGSQIHLEKSKFENNNAYILKIDLPDQICIVLAMQIIHRDTYMLLQNEDIETMGLHEKYQLFIEDVDYSADGSSHYIEYKGEAGDIKDGLFIDKHLPIYSSPTGSDSIIIGYKGTIVGNCIRKGTYLTYDTVDQCNGFFRSEKFAHYEPNCLRLIVSSELSIPINSYYEKLWNIEEGKRYIFECQFGYDGGWGDPGYPQYAEYLYVSGLITDDDFDPNK